MHEVLQFRGRRFPPAHPRMRFASLRVPTILFYPSSTEPQMTPRLDGRKYPQVLKPMLALAQYVEHSTLDPVLKELISFRASQLNGCAYCLDMHSKEMRVRGVDEQKIYLVGAWRDAPVFSERERAA